MKENGQTYDPCDVDICNGIEIDGNYVYVTTTFHPYIMGCYGKGNSPRYYQQCSTNPRLCNTVYTGDDGPGGNNTNPGYNSAYNLAASSLVGVISVLALM